MASLQSDVIQVTTQRADEALKMRVEAAGASDGAGPLQLEELPRGLQGLVMLFQETYLQDSEAAASGNIAEAWRAFVSQWRSVCASSSWSVCAKADVELGSSCSRTNCGQAVHQPGH